MNVYGDAISELSKSVNRVDSCTSAAVLKISPTDSDEIDGVNITTYWIKLYGSHHTTHNSLYNAYLSVELVKKRPTLHCNNTLASHCMISHRMLPIKKHLRSLSKTALMGFNFPYLLIDQISQITRRYHSVFKTQDCILLKKTNWKKTYDKLLRSALVNQHCVVVCIIKSNRKICWDKIPD